MPLVFCVVCHLVIILFQTKDSFSSINLSQISVPIQHIFRCVIFAGHDTTASGISWALYSLAKHPEHQRRVQEEIDVLMADKQEKRIVS